MAGGGADKPAPVDEPPLDTAVRPRGGQMFSPVLAALKRNRRLVAPLLAALVAAAIVAGISLATNSGSPRRSTPQAVGSIHDPGGLALQTAFVDVVQAVSPSVVQIETQQGLGSGIVFDGAGNIVTNNHVVDGSKDFVVTTSSGSRHLAGLVGAFPAGDLAVIRVSRASLRPATFADSSKLHVGDIAIAIGNPLGLRSSVTEGIVSAFRQGLPEGSGNVTLSSVIQTSAAINPGNSGGALVDIQGRVIGVPTLAATDPQLGGGSAPGIGFAIPSNTVKDIAGQIVAHGKVVDSHRAFLGVRVGDTNGIGVVVGSVTAGGPAAKAGMRVGDLIVAVDGTPITTTAELSAVLAGLKPGMKVPVVVRQQDGARKTLQVTVGTLPGD
jgi:putative serine protease PepD